MAKAGLELRPYQVEDLARLMSEPRIMNLSDPGTGKTPTACVYSQWLAGETGKAVAWVQPKALLRKNRDELIDWTDFDPEEIVIVDGTPQQRREQMAKPAKAYLMGFQRWSEDWEAFKGRTCGVVVDELHMGYSTWTSKRTQNLVQSMRYNEFFLPMTGTMIRGRLDSMYPTVHLIEPRYYGGGYNQFMQHHAVYDDWSGRVIGWKNIERISQIMARHGIRRTFKEAYGEKNMLPPFVERCDMTKKQRAAYREFEEKAILELEDKFIDGGLPGVFVIRCRQIMCHPHTMGLIKEDELSGKEEVLQIHVEDHLNTGDPFIIFASLVEEQKRLVGLLRKWGVKAEWMGGHTTTNARGDIDERFRRGEFQGLVASPQVAAFGFNWSQVNYVYFSSLDYSNDSFDQAVMRAIRGVREIPLKVTVLEYYDSIDQRLFEVVMRKSNLSHSVDASYGKIDLKSNVIELPTLEEQNAA